MTSTSPCIGICHIDEGHGFCRGCARSADEIIGWGGWPVGRRRAVWSVLPERRARLDMRIHRLDWTRDDIGAFVSDSLRPGGGTWVSGVHGAVAEFCVNEGETVDRAAGGADIVASTPRGAIAFALPERVRAIAFGVSPGTDVVVLAVPRDPGPDEGPLGLTSLGADCAAIQPGGGNQTLYDFGLGRAAARFGVRTSDPDLIARLNACIGLAWPALLAAAGVELLRVSPTRVVRNAVGRIEVFTDIPHPGGCSPRGPHTHFLPALLALGGDLPPSLPLPDGLFPCAVHYPEEVSAPTAKNA